MVIVYLVIFIPFWLLSIRCKSAIILAGAEAAAGLPVSRGAAWRSGGPAFGRLFRLELLLIAIGLVVTGTIIGGAVASVAGQQRVQWLPVLFGLFGVLALVAIVASVLGVIVAYAQRAIVLEQAGPIEGLKAGYGLVRRNLGNSVVLWLIALALSIGGGIALVIGLIVAAIPALIVGGILGLIVNAVGGPGGLAWECNRGRVPVRRGARRRGGAEQFPVALLDHWVSAADGRLATCATSRRSKAPPKPFDRAPAQRTDRAVLPRLSPDLERPGHQQRRRLDAQLGMGWLVVQLAEREGAPQLVPVYLGLVGLARGVPSIVAGLAAGVIADRVDRRKLLMGVQVYWALVSGVLAWLTITERITIGLVLALTVLSAIAQAFDGATRQTVFPRLVPRRAMVSAIGLNSMSFNVAQFIGPMIGGFLIVPIGVGGLMVLQRAVVRWR